MNSSFLPPYHSRSPWVLPMSVKGENTLGFPLPSSFFNTNCSWIVFQTSMNTFSHARIWQQLSSAGGWLIDELRRHSAVTITNNVFNFQLWIFTVTVAIKLVISFFYLFKIFIFKGRKLYMTECWSFSNSWMCKKMSERFCNLDNNNRHLWFFTTTTWLKKRFEFNDQHLISCGFNLLGAVTTRVTGNLTVTPTRLSSTENL